MNEPNNPYLAPGADLDKASGEDGVYEPRLLALKGRIGRLRYLAYLLALSGMLMAGTFVLVMLATFIGLAGGARGDALVAWVPMLLSVPFGAMYVVLAVRRLNDTARTGWLALLMFVPIVNFLAGLYLVFAPGTAGRNRYGLPPAPDSLAIRIAGWSMPVLMVASVVLSILVPLWMGGGSGDLGF